MAKILKRQVENIENGRMAPPMPVTGQAAKRSAPVKPSFIESRGMAMLKAALSDRSKQDSKQQFTSNMIEERLRLAALQKVRSKSPKTFVAFREPVVTQQYEYEQIVFQSLEENASENAPVEEGRNGSPRKSDRTVSPNSLIDRWYPAQAGRDLDHDVEDQYHDAQGGDSENDEDLEFQEAQENCENCQHEDLIRTRGLLHEYRSSGYHGWLANLFSLFNKFLEYAR